MSHRDEYWMGLALELASQGQGDVEPNPMVGCVIVQDDELIASGFHRVFGGTHAEVNAFAASSNRDWTSATVYVTLEPCSHYGKTPPCVDLLVKHRPRRVVVAMQDPFPEVAGRGIQALRDASIDVDVGVHESQARRMNAPYLKLLRTERPWTIAKWAMSLDGAIATSCGDSKWISNDASRRVVHEMRARVDAIIIGVGTAIADDPMLNARIETGQPLKRIATRVVLDSQARLPTQSKLVESAHRYPTMIAISDRCQNAVQIQRYRDAGCDVLAVPEHRGSLSLDFVLKSLGAKRMTNVIIEGGARVLGSAFDHRLVDEVHCFVAPKIIGGQSALHAIAGIGQSNMEHAIHLSSVETRMLGDNVYLHGSIASDGAGFS